MVGCQAHLSHLTDGETESPGRSLAQSHMRSPEAEDRSWSLRFSYLLSQPQGSGCDVPGAEAFQRGQLMGTAWLLGGWARPGGAGCWEVEGELRVGQGGGQPLEEAVLRLGPRPRAAGIRRPLGLWLHLGLRLGLWLWFLLGFQGAVTGDGRGGVDFIQGGARGGRQVSERLGGNHSEIIPALT